MKRISDFFKSIPSEVRLSKAELLLTVAVSALTGVVAGMLISPRKEQRYGCNNGNNFVLPEDDDMDVEYEFLEEEE